MPRHPDVPCAGCGRLIWRGTGSAAPGLARCRPCGGGKPRTRTCSRCPGPARPAVTTCSEQCRRAGILQANRGRPPRFMPCEDCGNGVVTAANRQIVCGQCAEERRRKRWRRKNAVRRGAGAFSPPMSLRELGVRDGWRCHLCRARVDPKLRAPHRMSGTFDHLIPVSEGGDDEAANLALAHWSCNSRRGARGTVQLLLVG